ncbi:hypothetical protein BDZ45DRAFT_315436 [Acephala macrosclerotiorum]|nr:hypothetical protein BDZ45DRAFT_315436 [Acephala macrosclerotiorum]
MIRLSSVASQLCSIIYIGSAPTTLSSSFTKACGEKSSKCSSACSCLKTATLVLPASRRSRAPKVLPSPPPLHRAYIHRHC